jgi:hypothetical protein
MADFGFLVSDFEICLVDDFIGWLTIGRKYPELDDPDPWVFIPGFFSIDGDPKAIK